VTVWAARSPIHMVSIRVRWVGLGLVLAVAACTGDIEGGLKPSQDGDVPPPPDQPTEEKRKTLTCSQPVAPNVYADKVKTLLTGQALQESELQELVEDRTRFRNLVEGWVDAPAADAMLLRFFRTAFQQEAFLKADFFNQFGGANINMGRFRDRTPGTFVEEVLFQNIEESFPRTALELVRSGQPFSRVATTQTFMMTTAMMVTLAFQDDHELDEDGVRRFKTLASTIRSIRYQPRMTISPAETLDPQHPNFMRFGVDSPPACLINQAQRGANPALAFEATMGFLSVPPNGVGNTCGDTRNFRMPPLLTPADFMDWRMVTVRPPNEGEKTDQFYELDRLRGSNALVLRTPRVGYFTTPAFMGLWATNEDNSARVITNQTLIVGFGHSFDGEDTLVPAISDSLDVEHADPGTECYACHKTLDPMRQFFLKTYNTSYMEQQDETEKSKTAIFAFGNVEQPGETMLDLGNLIAGHPEFATAWVQKLCWFANSAECPKTDEFFAVRSAFLDSGGDFRRLLVDLYSSPLVSGSSCLDGFVADTPGIARQDHFCNRLSQRLNLPDVCGQNLLFQMPGLPAFAAGTRTEVARLAPMVPKDGFSRGGARPVVLTDSSLFIHSGQEAICQTVSTRLFEAGGPYAGEQPTEVLRRLTEDLMGLPPSDPRHDETQALLTEHYEEVLLEKEEDSQLALQSATLLACLSPSVVGIGL
jgi:hypothetical protein